MAIELIDDGTLDTVLRCSECHEEMRYSTPMDAYDEHDGPCEHGVKSGGDGCLDCRDAWIAELIEECSGEHVCEHDDDDNGPEDGDYATSDHRKFFNVGGPGRLAFEVTETKSGLYRVHSAKYRNLGEHSTVERAIRAYMQADQYWPNCWFISDHGNAHLMDLGRA